MSLKSNDARGLLLKHSELIPASFKVANVNYLPKKNKDEDKAENYRPISLLSVKLKLMERMLYKRMELEIEKLLPSEQAEFRQMNKFYHSPTTMNRDIKNK